MTMVVGNYDEMKAEAHDDHALAAKLNGLVDENRRKASYIVESLDAFTGKVLGKVLVDTGNLSFKVSAAFTVGDHVIVSDSEHRTLLYSLQTGEHKGTLYGYALAFSPDGAKMMVENGKGKVDLYDLENLAAVSHFEFPFPVVRAQFSPDNGKIMVLTSDQTIYRLNVDAHEKSAAVH